MLGLPPAFNLSHDQTLQFKSFATPLSEEHRVAAHHANYITLYINRIDGHLLDEIGMSLLPERSFISPSKRPHELPEFFVKDRSSSHLVKRILNPFPVNCEAVVSARPPFYRGAVRCQVICFR